MTIKRVIGAFNYRFKRVQHIPVDRVNEPNIEAALSIPMILLFSTKAECIVYDIGDVCSMHCSYGRSLIGQPLVKRLEIRSDVCQFPFAEWKRD